MCKYNDEYESRLTLFSILLIVRYYHQRNQSHAHDLGHSAINPQRQVIFYYFPIGNHRNYVDCPFWHYSSIFFLTTYFFLTVYVSSANPLVLFRPDICIFFRALSMFFLVTQLHTPVCWSPNTNKPLGTGWHGNGVGCWWNTCKCWPICPLPTTSTGQTGFEIWCTCFTLWISVGWGSTIYVCQDILAMLLFDNSCFWQFLFFWFFFFLTDHSFDHSFLTIHS